MGEKGLPRAGADSKQNPAKRFSEMHGCVSSRSPVLLRTGNEGTSTAQLLLWGEQLQTEDRARGADGLGQQAVREAVKSDWGGQAPARFSNFIRHSLPVLSLPATHHRQASPQLQEQTSSSQSLPVLDSVPSPRARTRLGQVRHSPQGQN